MTKVFPERHCYDTWIQLGGSGLEPARGQGRPKSEGSGAYISHRQARIGWLSASCLAAISRVRHRARGLDPLCCQVE